MSDIESFQGSTETTCEDCGRAFTLTVTYTPDDAGGERVSFSCPHCDRRYDVAYVTPRGVEVREQLQKALVAWRSHKPRRPADFRRVQKLQKRMAAETKRPGEEGDDGTV